MRYIESDDNLTLRGDALREAIEDDIKLGLIPFWVSERAPECSFAGERAKADDKADLPSSARR